MNLTGKRILVTGSRGFIGTHLAERLTREGADVIGFDISSGIDITNWEQVKQYTDIDLIYHLAARTFIPSTSADPRQTFNINLNGTLNMLELARMNNVGKFIYASAYVYGQPQYLPVDENHPVNPVNPYNRSKVIGEELCRAYHEEYGLNCVIMRAFNIYGEGQRGDFLIPTILRQINHEIIQLNDAEPRRDFLYIDDAVEAYISAADYKKEGFGIFNIGSGESISVDEIVNKVLSISGRDIPVNYLQQRRENEILDVIADITKAKKELSWEPQIPLEKGLRKCIEWLVRVKRGEIDD
jgi:UDP-glucose 4-epimerase